MAHTRRQPTTRLKRTRYVEMRLLTGERAPSASLRSSVELQHDGGDRGIIALDGLEDGTRQLIEGHLARVGARL